MATLGECSALSCTPQAGHFRAGDSKRPQTSGYCPPTRLIVQHQGTHPCPRSWPFSPSFCAGPGHPMPHNTRPGLGPSAAPPARRQPCPALGEPRARPLSFASSWAEWGQHMATAGEWWVPAWASLALTDPCWSSWANGSSPRSPGTQMPWGPGPADADSASSGGPELRVCHAAFRGHTLVDSPLARPLHSASRHLLQL